MSIQSDSLSTDWAHDSDTLVAEAEMSWTGAEVIVIVEGDTDQWFVGEIEENCTLSVINAGGKPAIEQSMQELLSLSFPVVVLLDRDFDEFNGALIDHERVVYTDLYNLEATLLLDTEVLQTMYKLHLRPEERMLDLTSLREILIRLSHPVAQVRFANMRLKADVTLSDFPLSVVVEGVNPEEMNCDIDDVIELALQRSAASTWVCGLHEEVDERTKHASQRLSDEVRALPSHAPIAIVSGHDVASAFNLVLRSIRRTGIPSARDLEYQAAVSHRCNTAQMSVGRRILEAVAMQRERYISKP